MTIIAYLWGIHTLTPIKCVWIALTLANVGMMLWLAWRYFGSPHTFVAALYFLCSAMFSALQGTKEWAIQAELSWAAIATCWTFSMLPRDRYGRIFALSIGLLITCALMYAVPPSWPKYDPTMYYLRIYSTAAFLGVVFATSLLQRTPLSTVLAIPWFGSTLLAGANHETWAYWTVAVAAKGIWTCCLIGWLYLSRSGALIETGDFQTPSNAVLPRSHRE